MFDFSGCEVELISFHFFNLISSSPLISEGWTPFAGVNEFTIPM